MRLRVSATMPWPAKAASPWMRSAIAAVGSWLSSGSSRPVCSARAVPTTTGSTASRWLGFDASSTLISPCFVEPDALRAVVVLHVAGAALGVVRDRLERPLALELLEDHLVGPSERVGDHVQPAAVGHAEHDVLGAVGRGELERLVEHRDHHVEPRERERLLAEERAAQIRLEALGLGQAMEQPLLLLGVERLAVAARLDRVAEPHALLVVRDVLDLVRHRPAVGRAELREDFAERFALAVQAEEPRRDARLELRRQLRDQPVGVERGIPGRRGAERIEVRGEMAVHPVRLDERHCGGDASEQLLVDRSGLGGRSRWSRGAVPVGRNELMEPLRGRQVSGQVGIRTRSRRATQAAGTPANSGTRRRALGHSRD